MEITFIAIFIGIILILSGIICQKYPRFISGYDPRNPPTEAMLRKLNKACLITALVLMGGVFVSEVFLKSDIAVLFFLIAPMLVFVVYQARIMHLKYKRYVLVFTAVLLLAVLGLGIYAMQEPVVSVRGQSVSISGLYGTSIPKEEIVEVDLLDSLPPIGLRSNGFAMRNVKKGYFKLPPNKKGLLFVHSASGPCLSLVLMDGREILINFQDADHTRFIFETLRNSQ